MRRHDVRYVPGLQPKDPHLLDARLLDTPMPLSIISMAPYGSHQPVSESRYSGVRS